MFNDAADKVQRAQRKEAPELKRTRYLWLKNERSLSASQRRLHTPLLHSRRHLKTVRAYQFKLSFQDFWGLPPDQAPLLLRGWCGPVKECGVEPMACFSRTVEALARGYQSIPELTAMNSPMHGTLPRSQLIGNSEEPSLAHISSVLKRSLDIMAAVAGLVLLAPLLLVVALLVRINLGAPVLFRQQRPGLHGQPFEIVKFRTMTDERDAEGALLPEAERLTRMGRFLRSTSLDELPELWNVLKGDMSLVGPRPLRMEYLPLYSDRQARRHQVRPGITGWAQVQGRNLLSWPERLEMDVWYVENRGLWLDVRILLLTLVVVLKRTGVSPEQSATMEPFRGESLRD